MPMFQFSLIRLTVSAAMLTTISAQAPTKSKVLHVPRITSEQAKILNHMKLVIDDDGISKGNQPNNFDDDDVMMRIIFDWRMK